MVVVLFPAGITPDIGIDDPHHQLGAVVFEERLQLGRQDVDCPRHDETVRGGAPRQCRSRRSDHEDECRRGHEPFSHPAILRALAGIRCALWPHRILVRTVRPLERNGQRHPHPVRPHPGAHAAGARRARHHGRAGPGIERAGHRHRGHDRGCAELPDVAPRPDARPARHRRPRPGGGGSRVDRAPGPAAQSCTTSWRRQLAC